MIEWEFEAYPDMGDLALVPFAALVFLVVRFLLDRLLLEKIGRLLLLGSSEGLSQQEQKEMKKRLKKAKESSWKFLYYLSAELFELAILYKETWFTNTRHFWVGPGDQVWPDQKVKSKIKALYVYTAGFYLYSFFAAIFWETRRSDFVLTVLHHIATVVLIILSYVLRFARVGCVVLAIHDASDVVMELSKTLKYAGYDLIPSITFIMFFISWLLLRVIYFPIWVIWSTSYEVLLTLDTREYTNGTIYYYVFNTLLICLFILNIYWWMLMCRMLEKQIKSQGKVGDDVRSDSEGEDEKEE